MSVIIRLQNLPWSANALDVRNFFKGLSIPDGGVHIVGGEMGDAFIAFSTDEDARQAMMMNGGKIKEVQVTLLLSSRAEMQKVIEEARRTTVSFMQLSAQSAPAIPQQPPIIPKAAMPAVTVAQQPQPPVISLSGFLAQNLNQQKNQAIYSEIPGLGYLGGGMFQPNAPAAGLFSALNAQSYNAGASTNAAFTQLSEQLKKVGEAEKAAGSMNVPASNSSSLKKESGERNSRRSRSSSRERDRRRSSRDRSRSRDRGSRRRGRDRSRSRDRRSRSRSRDRRDRRRRSRSRDRRDDRTRDKSRERDQKASSDKNSKQRGSRFTDRGDSKPSSEEVVKIPSPKLTPTALQPTSFTSPWDTPIHKNLLNLANSGSEKPVVQPSIPSPLQSSKAAGDEVEERTEPEQKTFVQNPILSYRMNLMPAVNYGSFQSSKPLSNEQLSKLQQLQTQRDSKIFQDSTNMGGNRQGGHFSDGESTTVAGNNNNNNKGRFDFPPRRDGGNNRSGDGYSTDGGLNKRNQSMEERSGRYDDIEGQSVKISHLQNVTGYGEVRRFFHGQTISSNGIKMINDKNGRRTGVALIRFMRKDGKRYALSRDGMRLKNSVVKIEPITDQEFDEAVDSYRPGYDDVPNNWREVNADRFEQKEEDVIEIGDEDQEGKQGSVVVWNLPSMTSEVDLMRIFSDFSVVEVLIIKNYKNPKQLDGYVKFHRLQDARRACNATHKHYVRNKRVFVKQCSDIEYDAAKNEYEAPQEPEPVTVELDDSIQDSNESTKDSKKQKSDDDQMDLAEDEEDDEDRLQININEPTPQDEPEYVFGSPPPNMPSGLPGTKNNEYQQAPVNRGPLPNQQFDDKIQEESWEPEQAKQSGPPLNRDPRGMVNLNFNQQQQQQQQQQPPNLQQQQQQQQQAQQISQLNLGFGGDMNRDPRRRQDASNQQFGMDQGPPPLIDSNRFGQQQMGPMGHNNRYDQQQMGNNRYDQQQQQMSNNRYDQQQQMNNNRYDQQQQMGNNRYDQQQQISNNRYDQQQQIGNNRYDQQQQMGNNNHGSMGNRFNQQMDFNQGPPMGGNRFDQQMGNNQEGSMGNNRYQHQQQMPSAQGGQYGNNRFNQQTNRNNDADEIAGANDKTTFILITNLEYALQESKIYDFFDQEGFSPKHVHIVRNRNGRSIGECLVEFESPQEAEEALSKHGEIVGKRKAFIRHLNRKQIMDQMQRMNKNGPGQNYQREGNTNFGSNNFDGNDFRSNLGRNNFGNNGKGGFEGNDNRFMNDNRNFHENNFRENNYRTCPDETFGDKRQEDDAIVLDDNMDQPQENEKPVVEVEKCIDQQTVDIKEIVQPIKQDQQDARNVGNVSVQHGPEKDDPPVKQPGADYLQQSKENQDEDVEDEEAEGEEHEEESSVHNEDENHDENTQQEQHTELQPQHQMRESQGLQQSQTTHQQESEKSESTMQDEHEPDMQQDSQSEPIKGNILCLGNLPFRAKNEELVVYFREYNITIEDVKRRYLPDGRTTGDAMVRFRSAVDAKQAMQSHYNRRIGGRPVRMRILDD
ncbi:uncharacterized protein LOC134210753 isoform X2 [Armigeres subalbatus]|uniref:uncharacterized protein LOC134210753 isoform X2 n=1 Tax=Armigeres subalbatus TaxID=124917 RepID=UPI002ED3945A